MNNQFYVTLLLGAVRHSCKFVHIHAMDKLRWTSNFSKTHFKLDILRECWKMPSIFAGHFLLIKEWITSWLKQRAAYRCPYVLIGSIPDCLRNDDSIALIVCDQTVLGNVQDYVESANGCKQRSRPIRVMLFERNDENIPNIRDLLDSPCRINSTGAGQHAP
jgi:hypothetical protein